MRGSKILITGATGQVAVPIALALAADNEVWGVARFTDPAVRERLERAGVRCETVNMVAGDFTGIPSDFDYVLNFAVAKSGRWDKDLAVNAESAGLVMAHCPGVTAFLHCSSGSGLRPAGRRTADRTHRLRRQPHAPASHLLHLQDRRGSRCRDHGACPRRAGHHCAPQRPLRR